MGKRNRKCYARQRPHKKYLNNKEGRKEAEKARYVMSAEHGHKFVYKVFLCDHCKKLHVGRDWDEKPDTSKFNFALWRKNKHHLPK